MGITLEPIEFEMLTAQMRESAMASAEVRFAETDCPDWLRRPPNGPELFNESAVPIEWAAGRLVERYRLPWKMASSISFYILTLDSSWITTQEPLPLEVCIDHDSPSDPDAFTVTVRGIDEFITKKDWDCIWERHIRRPQDKIWRQRGRKPQGRRAVDIDRLKDAMPVYQQMVEKEFSVKKIWDEPSVHLGEAELSKDLETVRRAVRDLNHLLKPMP